MSPSANYEQDPRNPDAIILDEITAHERISYADYMNACLYSPRGYYASGSAAIGTAPGSDFRTAPMEHPFFGGTLARGIHQMWENLGNPSDFHVVEMGAGNGVMAQQIIDKTHSSLPDAFGRALTYHIVEVAPGMIEQQQKTLGDRPVQWHRQSAAAMDIRDVTGVFISNELPDTFPVHRIKKIGGKMLEVYITRSQDGRQLVEVDGEPNEAIQDDFYSQALRHVPEGVALNACPAMRSWQHSLGAALAEGGVISIDYGMVQPYNRPELFAPRIPGKHTRKPSVNILDYQPGENDITTSVDFTAMQTAGEEAGLKSVLCVPQPDLLERMGIWDEYNQLVQRRGPFKSYLGKRATGKTHYEGMRRLISHDGYGKFLGLVQTKGCGSPGFASAAGS